MSGPTINDYAALGRFAESTGKFSFGDDGELLSEAPLDYAVEQATEPLHAEIARLREALEPFATDYDEAWSPEQNGGHRFPDAAMIEGGSSALTVGDLRRAKAALSPDPVEGEEK